MPPVDRSPKSAVLLDAGVAGVRVLLPDRRLLGLRDRVEAVERRRGRGLALRRPADVRRDGVRRAVVLLARRGLVGVVPAPRRVGRRVVADAERPALVGRLADQVPLARAGRGALRTVGRGVVAVLAHADQARVLGVGVQRERLAEAHRVDLGTGLGHAGREQVARRDRVRRTHARGRVRGDRSQRRLDAEHLAAQVGRVGRGLAGVPALGGAVVHRDVAAVAGRVRRHVVTDAEVQVALGVEVQAGATDVARAGVRRTAREAGRRAADLRLGNAQDHALGVGLHRLAVGGQRPAADLVVAHGLRGRGGRRSASCHRRRGAASSTRTRDACSGPRDRSPAAA